MKLVLALKSKYVSLNPKRDFLCPDRHFTSALRSERILTTHLLTAIWKVKLMTPRIFSKASSHRLLRV